MNHYRCTRRFGGRGGVAVAAEILAGRIGVQRCRKLRRWLVEDDGHSANGKRGLHEQALAPCLARGRIGLGGGRVGREYLGLTNNCDLFFAIVMLTVGHIIAVYTMASYWLVVPALAPIARGLWHSNPEYKPQNGTGLVEQVS